MSDLLGNVFRPGQKACLCLLELSGDSVLAHPKDKSIESFRFPLRDEHLSFAGDAGSQVVLKNADGVTLYAERKDLEPRLQALGNRMFQERLRSESKKVRWSNSLSLAAFFGFFAGCGLLFAAVMGLLSWGVDRAVDQIPVSWEEKLGDAAVSSGLGPEIDDPKVKEPVQAVLDRLLTATPDQPYTMKLHIVDNEQINAFAAPGGQIVVFTGLLQETKGPDELAGVLAHELQHVYHRHGIRGMMHQLKWHLVAALVLGDVGSVQQLLLANAPKFASLSYGRSLEEEADMEGIGLLCKAHLNPQGMVDFFGVLKENETVRIPEFLADHPDTAKRVQSLEQWIGQHQDCKPEPLDVDWKAMQEALKADLVR